MSQIYNTFNLLIKNYKEVPKNALEIRERKLLCNLPAHAVWLLSKHSASFITKTTVRGFRCSGMSQLRREMNESVRKDGEIRLKQKWRKGDEM